MSWNEPDHGTPEPAGAREGTGFRLADADAFEQLFRMHASALCALAFRYVRSRDVAADVVQDVFLRLWSDRAQWQVNRSIKAYLYVAVRNRALDLIKHDRVERRWVERTVRESPADDEAVPLFTESSKLDAVAGSLEQLLADFPERRREAFLLRFRDGYSYADIARRMGTTTKTVENQISRALRRLRDVLLPRSP